MKTMKIAVPSVNDGGLNSNRSDHFGHSPQFTLVDIEAGAIGSVTTLANPPHQAGGCMAPVMSLKDSGVDSLIVSGIGGGPFKRLAEVGIRVFYADPAQYPDVQTAVTALLGKGLPQFATDQLCQSGGTCHSHG